MNPQKKVLVVENDEVVLVLISHILTRQSYLVHTAADALQAQRLIEQEPYDAILLDLKMPHGGIDLIRRIEERSPALLQKIIVVTGAIQEAAKIAGVPLHAMVRKPFEVTALIETVRSCVEKQP